MAFLDAEDEEKLESLSGSWYDPFLITGFFIINK